MVCSSIPRRGSTSCITHKEGVFEVNSRCFEAQPRRTVDGSAEDIDSAVPHPYFWFTVLVVSVGKRCTHIHTYRHTYIYIYIYIYGEGERVREGTRCGRGESRSRCE